MRAHIIRAIAAGALAIALGASPAAAQAPSAPEWVEPGRGQPSDPPCQGEDRSTRAQSEPGRQGELARRLATSTDYGVGDNVTAHHTEHGSCAEAE